MKEKTEGQKLAGADLVAKCFGIIVVVLYVTFGTTIILKAPEMRTIPELYAIFFGTTLILYGLYRGYKLYRKYFSSAN